MNKPRKWWLAGLLSLLEPGLGQIYNGQGRKGLSILLLKFLLLPAMILGLNSDNIKLLLIFFVIVAVVYYLFAVVDAVTAALGRRAKYRVKRYNNIVVYILVVVLAGVLNTTLSVHIKNNYVQAYKIPAASNEPTLFIGDHILLDRRVSARKPTFGDLVVFEFPRDPEKDFIKRVVGIGGDTIEIRNKAVFLNGEKINESYVVHRESEIIPAHIGPRDFFGPVTVPEDSYFVLGDNRDRSYDSRFWGFVKKEQIKGTVKTVYWSWDAQNASVRWERIGTAM